MERNINFWFFILQSGQSLQSLQNINLDNYGYSMSSPFGEMMAPQRGQMGEQGLSPPYSNQSPPHSVQSNMALSPQAYIGKNVFQVVISSATMSRFERIRKN